MSTARQTTSSSAPDHPRMVYGESDPHAKPSRWKRRLTVALILVVVLIASAPMIVAVTPLCNVVANAALADGQGVLSIGSASLGWFTSVELTDVDWRDDSGERMLLVPRLTLDRSLGQLLMSRADLGTIRVEQPELNVRLRADGSNLEDALAPWLEPSESEPVSIAVNVEGGKVTIHDTVAEQTWHIDPLAVSFSTAADEQAPTTLEVTARTPAGAITDRADGELKTNLTVNPAGESTLNVESKTLPLALVESIVARFSPLTELAGTLTTNLEMSWNADAESRAIDVRGQTNVDRLALAGAAWGPERLELARLEFPCQLQLDGEQLNVEQLQIRCDVGELSAAGKFHVGNGADVAAAVRDAEVPQDFLLSGKLDLAKIAQMVPGVLNVREGTTITGGTAEISLTSAGDGAGQRWSGSLATQNLAANVDGRQVSWQQPIRLEFAAKDADVWNIEQLTVQSDFLQLQATGDPRKINATGTFDLNKLASRLGQFVDLNSWQLAGQGETQLEWTLDDQRQFRAGGSFALRSFALARPGEAAWQESNLNVSAAADGTLAPESWTLAALTSASAKLTSGEDQLDIRYLPASDGDAQSWPLAITMQGQLASWQRRLAAVMPLEGWRLGGRLDLVAQAVYSPVAIAVTAAKLTITDLVASSAERLIREPQVELTGEATWNTMQSRLDVSALQLTTSAVGARFDQLAVTFPGEGDGENAAPHIKGDLAYQVSLDKLNAWLQSPQQPPTLYIAGNVQGQAHVEGQGAAMTARVDAVGRDIVLWQLGAPAAGGGREPDTVLWQEPSPTLKLASSFDKPNDRLLLESATFNSNSFQFTASGTIDRASAEQNLDLAGKIDVAPEQLTKLLTPKFADGLTLVGQDGPHFTVKGPLAASNEPAGDDDHWSNRLTANFDYAWHSGTLYGTPIGPAKLEAQVRDGQVFITPVDLQIGEGRLTLAPHVRLSPEPALLTMPAGPVLQNLDLNTQIPLSSVVSENFLRFVTPIIPPAKGSSAPVEGRVSLSLQGATIPLDDPELSQIDGQLRFQQLVITPGPFAKEIIMYVEQVENIINRRRGLLGGQPSTRTERPLLELEDHKIDFRVADGRVYHGDTTFQVGEATIHSSGSVGFDQTLAMQFAMPLPAKWTTGGPIRESLRGQTITIPVGGTLEQPQVDGRVVASLGEQLLRGAVGDTINREVNSLLDRLLPPRPNR